MDEIILRGVLNVVVFIVFAILCSAAFRFAAKKMFSDKPGNGKTVLFIVMVVFYLCVLHYGGHLISWFFSRADSK